LQRIRKSQMEILGLAFVFIILIFGLMIFLRLGSNDSNTRDVYTDPQLSASFISSILKTTVDCSSQQNHSLTVLLKDCASSKRLTCQDENSCNASINVISFMLNETLIREAKSFYFNVNSSTGNNIITNSSSRCNARSPGIFYSQPFDANGNIVYINLKICHFS
jgi:hypothetical protein